MNSFRCSHCASLVVTGEGMGTAHRNHCTVCLWSEHVDSDVPGDRTSTCGAPMEPIGITLKHEGKDKYTKKEKYGDVMLIHRCAGCGKININRVAADDPIEAIMVIYDQSLNMDAQVKERLVEQGITLFGESQKPLVVERLLGKRTDAS